MEKSVCSNTDKKNNTYTHTYLKRVRKYIDNLVREYPGSVTYIYKYNIYIIYIL